MVYRCCDSYIVLAGRALSQTGDEVISDTRWSAYPGLVPSPYASLQRTEAQARRALLDVVSYDVSLDLASDAASFGSVTTVRRESRCRSVWVWSSVSFIAVPLRRIVRVRRETLPE